MQWLNCLFIFFAVVLLSACWDYTPLEKALNITAIGIDIDEKKPEEIRVTFIGPQQSISSNTSQTSNDSDTSQRLYSITTASGKTIQDALSKVKNSTNQEVHMTSLKLVLFSMNIAQKDLFPYVDALLRNPQVHSSTLLCVSEEEPLEVLSYESQFVAKIPIHIPDLLNSSELNTHPQLFQLSHFTNAIYGENQSFALPIISLQKSQKNIQLKAIGIFKEGKLMDTLDQRQSFPYFFLKKRLKKFELSIDAKKISPLQKGSLSFMLSPQKNSVKPFVNQNTLQFDMDFTVTGKVLEQSRTFNPLNVLGLSFFPNFHNQHVLTLAIESFLEKHLSATLVKMLKKTQEEYTHDIFGFGTMVRIKYPAVYAQKSWQETYKHAKFNVHMKVDLKSSGILFLR